MNRTRTMLAVWAVVGSTSLLRAEGSHSHTSRTYMGRPGIGPYAPAPHYQNPWTVKIMGLRVNQTPEDQYQRFLRQYQIAQAQHEARLNQLNWKAYHLYTNPRPNSLNGFAKRCDCSDGYASGGGGGAGGACDADGWATCEGEGGWCASHCVGDLMKKLFTYGDCHPGKQCCAAGGVDPSGRQVNRGDVRYPGMNREDAVRFLEGHQYYPPNHLLHSPRDFFMFDVKYGEGKK